MKKYSTEIVTDAFGNGESMVATKAVAGLRRGTKVNPELNSCRRCPHRGIEFVVALIRKRKTGKLGVEEGEPLLRCAAKITTGSAERPSNCRQPPRIQQIIAIK